MRDSPATTQTRKRLLNMVLARVRPPTLLSDGGSSCVSRRFNKWGGLSPTDDASELATLSAKTSHSLRSIVASNEALAGSMTCNGLANRPLRWTRTLPQAEVWRQISPGYHLHQLQKNQFLRFSVALEGAVLRLTRTERRERAGAAHTHRVCIALGSAQIASRQKPPA